MVEEEEQFRKDSGLDSPRAEPSSALPEPAAGPDLQVQKQSDCSVDGVARR